MEEKYPLKCLFLKGSMDTREFSKSMKYEDIKNLGYSMYDILPNANNVGFVLGVQGDFIIHDGPADPGTFNDYDIVIATIHTRFGTQWPRIKSKFREGQLLAYMEAEPPGNESRANGRNWNAVTDGPIHPYDYLLNFYTLGTQHSRNIPTMHVYDLDFFKTIKAEKEPNKIFLQKRGVKGEERSGWRDRFPTKYKLMNEWMDTMGAKKPYTEYLKELRSCTYAISSDWTDSPGQITAEACMLDTITFAPPHKAYTPYLLPEYCWFNNLSEVLSKIEELEKNPELKNKILSQIRTNVKKLDYHTFGDNMLKLYEKFVANGRKA